MWYTPSGEQYVACERETEDKVFSLLGIFMDVRAERTGTSCSTCKDTAVLGARCFMWVVTHVRFRTDKLLQQLLQLAWRSCMEYRGVGRDVQCSNISMDCGGELHVTSTPDQHVAPRPSAKPSSL